MKIIFDGDNSKTLSIEHEYLQGLIHHDQICFQICDDDKKKYTHIYIPAYEIEKFKAALDLISTLQTKE